MQFITANKSKLLKLLKREPATHPQYESITAWVKSHTRWYCLWLY